MSRRDEMGTVYADNLYRKHGCSPNNDGKWLTHKTDFLSGFDAAISLVREWADTMHGKLNGIDDCGACTLMAFLDSLTEEKTQPSKDSAKGAE